MNEDKEKEYQKIYEEFNPQIQEKLDLAEKFLKEAVELSNKTGVRFSSEIYHSYNGCEFVPDKYFEFFPEEDNDYRNHLGWVSSTRTCGY